MLCSTDSLDFEDRKPAHLPPMQAEALSLVSGEIDRDVFSERIGIPRDVGDLVSGDTCIGHRGEKSDLRELGVGADQLSDHKWTTIPCCYDSVIVSSHAQQLYKYNQAMCHITFIR